MVDRLVNSEANARRISNVEHCFGMSGVPLALPGRVLVGEGVLTKICRKKPKPRQVFLFNDILVYGSILINKKKYNRQHIIPLEEVQLEDVKDEGELKNGWLIKTQTKSFAVYAATPTEKVEWMAHINKCVQDLLKLTGKRPRDQHAAVWIPDSASNVCMSCNKTQFTVLNRRHHCRSCGSIVCGSCSKNKFLLPAQSSKPVRVCTGCYEKLSGSPADLVTDDGSKLKSGGEHAIARGEGAETSDSEDDDRVADDSDNIQEGLRELNLEEKATFYNGDQNESNSNIEHDTNAAQLDETKKSDVQNANDG